MKPMKKNLFLLISAALLSAGHAGTAAIIDGLIGHWTFDETSGTTAGDTSGNSNNGTVSNSLGDNPQWGTGKIGGALNCLSGARPPIERESVSRIKQVMGQPREWTGNGKQ